MGLHQEVVGEELYQDRKQHRVIDFLEYWITTIVTYAKGEQENFPKIILIGTHKDEVKDEAHLQTIRNGIQETFHDMIKSTQLIVKEDLFISATDMSDDTRSSIRKIILEEGMKYSEFGERIPKTWVPLQESLKRERRCIVPKESVDNINRKLGNHLDEEELDIFLRYLHNIGHVLYFSAPHLNEYVILDPKIVIDAMKSFITCDRFVLNPSKRKILKEIKKTGEVKRSDILKMWKGRVLSEYNEHVLAIMQRLFLICEPMVYKEGRTLSMGLFIVPSMVSGVKEEISELQICRDTQVVLVFSSEKLIPTAIFNRLICSCIALWTIFNKHLYNGLVVLKSGKYHLIEIRRQVKDVTVKIMHTEPGRHPDTQLCLAIKQFLVETISEIVSLYNTSSDGPIKCDSNNLDEILLQRHPDIGLGVGKEEDVCKCDAYTSCKLQDVNLMRIAVLMQRVDLSVICSALLNDAEYSREIENSHSTSNGSVKIFYVLQQWKEQTQNFSVTELRSLFEYHLECLNKHIVCQALADEIINPDKMGIDHTILVSKAYPEFLDAVADKLSYRYLHLGLELGLSLEEMERFKMEKKRIVEISRAMLTQWYDMNSEEATILNLFRAFHRCGVRNLEQIASEFKLEVMMQCDESCQAKSETKNKCLMS